MSRGAATRGTTRSTNSRAGRIRIGLSGWRYGAWSTRKRCAGVWRNNSVSGSTFDCHCERAGGDAISVSRRRLGARPMLTKDLLFGMNALSLAGFAVMFVALNTARQPNLPKIWSIGLMGAGTMLLFAGLYLRTPAG
jgi:hypothetical protein